MGRNQICERGVFVLIKNIFPLFWPVILLKKFAQVIITLLMCQETLACVLIGDTK